MSDRGGSRPSPDLDRAWQIVVSLVMDSRGDWRRKVADRAGLPFTRVRALRRLKDGPRTLGELAEAMDSDAPAATVIVNDLEARGLVTRRPHPTDGRVKVVSLTPAGKRTLAVAHGVGEHAPEALSAMSRADAAELLRILAPFARR